MTKIAIIGACAGLAMALANRLEKDELEIIGLDEAERRNTYSLGCYPLADIDAVSMPTRGKGKGDRIRRRQQWNRK